MVLYAALLVAYVSVIKHMAEKPVDLSPRPVVRPTSAGVTT